MSVNRFLYYSFVCSLLVLSLDCACDFVVCSYNYTGKHKALGGRNQWTSDNFPSPCTNWSTSPVEHPGTVTLHYNDGCWTITDVSLSTEGDLARCSVCNNSISGAPWKCPSWVISSEIDAGFTLVDGPCSATDYTNISTPQNLSQYICAYNRSSDWYTEQPETIGDWTLYDIDSNDNGYYYRYRYPYFYQMMANSSTINFSTLDISTSSNTWIWAIADFVLNPTPNGFCIMQYDNECPLERNILCVHSSQFAPFELLQFSSYIYYYSWDGFMSGSPSYNVFYQDFHWVIGKYSDFNEYYFDITQAECSIYTTPFDVSKCNGYWMISNQSECCDS